MKGTQTMWIPTPGNDARTNANLARGLRGKSLLAGGQPFAKIQDASAYSSGIRVVLFFEYVPDDIMPVQDG